MDVVITERENNTELENLGQLVLELVLADVSVVMDFDGLFSLIVTFQIYIVCRLTY